MARRLTSHDESSIHVQLVYWHNTACIHLSGLEQCCTRVWYRD